MTRESRFAANVPLLQELPLGTLLDGTPSSLFPDGGETLGELLGAAGLPADGLPDAREGIHGVTHYRMVAALAVRLGLSEGLDPEGAGGLGPLWCLWVAGCLHDLERWDDALDWGHAARGAKLARRWLSDQGVGEERAEGVAGLIRGHGERDERNLDPLQRLFKDADGLDRFRLGRWQCDLRMLRTPSARALWPELRDLYRERG